MAATTSGWQWPVDATAMPAVKSKKRLPSTSSIVEPKPRATTKGYIRVYDGDITRASRASQAAAFGPGKPVTSCGTRGGTPGVGIEPESEGGIVGDVDIA